MSIEYYYVNDLNKLYNAAVGNKTDGGEYHTAMMEAHDNLEEYIAELEAAQRWIPVSERLPENSDWTLIRYKGYRVPYTLYYDIDRGWACGETPDYWMSLPEMQEVNNE